MSAQLKQVEVRERPILFSGPMVRAILEGRKTQTRRVRKLPVCCVDCEGEQSDGFICATCKRVHRWPTTCPYGQAGNHLWVRETFAPCIGGAEGPDNPTLYRADAVDGYDRLTWKPSIFMPRWASRITLEITNVRVERLQIISEEDAIAEGMQRSDNTGMYPSPQGNCDHASWAFHYGWDSINGKRKGCAWADNPWVWVIEFKKL